MPASWSRTRVPKIRSLFEMWTAIQKDECGRKEKGGKVKTGVPLRLGKVVEIAESNRAKVEHEHEVVFGSVKPQNRSVPARPSGSRIAA